MGCPAVMHCHLQSCREAATAPNSTKWALKRLLAFPLGFFLPPFLLCQFALMLIISNVYFLEGSGLKEFLLGLLLEFWI